MAPLRTRDAAVAITGGARGIGLATARAFASAGAKVVIGDMDAELSKQAAAEVGGHGFALDVRSAESFRTFLADAEMAVGPLDVLVNNAGIMPLGSIVTETADTTEAIIDINVKGVINGTKLVLPGMIERRRGHIVNIASMAGRVPVAGGATYCASKFAVIGFSRSVRDEVAGSGVTVTAVMPTAVRTELMAGLDEGGILPVVDPDVIANAVVTSCKARPATMPVPGWLGLYDLVEALAPSGPFEAIRRKLSGARVFGLDQHGRANYDQRVRAIEVTHG